MQRANLDVVALRASRTHKTDDTANSAKGGPAVSRRRALGLAGVAAAGASPAFRAVEGSLLGSFEMLRSGKGRVAFLYGGVERWVIDIRRFAGTPILEVQQTPEKTLIALRGARYPGTAIPADLRCTINRAATGWRMRLEMSFGSFSAGGGFITWLAGLEALRGPVHIKTADSPLGGGATLIVAGDASAAFTPDWVLDLEGKTVATLQGIGAPIASDSLRLTLPAPDAAGLLSAPPARRTAITLWRGERDWPLQPDFQPAGLWRLVTTPTSFKEIGIEFGENASGQRLCAFAAEAGETLSFQPHTGFTTAGGDAVALPLGDARYAVAFEAAGSQRSLVARFQEQPTWLHVGGCAVALGSAPGTPPFELQARGTAATAVHCTPAVLGLSVPVAGAVASPAGPAAGTHLAFVTDGLARSSAASAAAIVLSSHPKDAIARFTLINPRFSVVRPDDLLALTFEFIDMKVQATTGKTPVLVPRTAKSRPYLAVHIQGQNIAEHAFFRVLPALPVPPTYPGPGAHPDPDLGAKPKSGTTAEFPEGLPAFPDGKRLADESRLVFAMPAGFKSLPLTLEALLDWSQFTPSVPPTALPAGEYTKAAIAEPLGTETSLEIPWRLKISPNRYSGWLHAFTPVTHNGWTELWHTRLGVKITTKATTKSPARTFLVDEHYAYEAQTAADGKKYAVTLDTYAGGKPVDLLQAFRTIRAVWSQDYPQVSRLKENVPFRMSLTGQDRFDLVNLTSFFKFATPPAKKGFIGPIIPLPVAIVQQHFNPLPVQVNRLMLTTLGAWVDFHGAWSQGYHVGIALEEWTHRGTQARDNYVRVVYKGYLFPFGHRASLVKITERKFYLQNGRNVAYLFQRMFIIVREPLKQFGTSGFKDASGRSIDRGMPFKQVRITTTTTPDLDPPVRLDPTVGTSSTDAFWPQINKQDFLFHLVGIDSDGQQTDFTAPLAFISVEDSLAFQNGPMLKVAAKYASNIGLYPSRHTRPTHGSKVAFAPSNRPGDTTLHAESITFAAFVPPQTTGIPDDQPRFYPITVAAAVGIPAVEALLRSGQKPSIKLSDHFLIDGLGGTANSGEVFAEILGATKPTVNFGGSGSGGTSTPGVVAPNLSINALSRVMGPVGGDVVAQVAGGSVADPSAFLEKFFDESAKILGAIPLSEIIKLPSLGPIFKVLSLVQAIENYPDTLSSLADQATSALQGNLAALSAQARAALQNQLAPVRAQLAAIKTPLNSLQSGLNAVPGIVKDLLGDLTKPLADLSALIGDLTALLAALDKLLADLGAANLGALQGDANNLKTKLTAFPDDMSKLVKDITSLDGINALPVLKHGQLPTAIDTTLNWTPHLQASKTGIFKPLDNFLSVHATVHIPLDGTAPTYNITGTLGKFVMNLFNIIKVSFGGLSFTAQSGEKPDVTAAGVEVLFEGPLAFVNDLKDFIPSSGFEDPPYVDVESDHLEAGFNLDLPSIGVGIFSLENVSLGAKVTVPFIGSSPAQLYFNFCTREHPFILTVSMLGGGGFFGITVGLDGLDMLEASFEFGAELSLDFGIASGSVSIMAGVYFKIEKTPKDQTILTGFVHIHGEVEALAILSVSIDVELDLTYEKDGKDTKVVGTATLTISVHVLFFSVTVSASVHREFAGSHNDPTFADQISEQDWTKYLKAFA